MNDSMRYHGDLGPMVILVPWRVGEWERERERGKKGGMGYDKQRKHWSIMEKTNKFSVIFLRSLLLIGHCLMVDSFGRIQKDEKGAPGN